MERDMNEVDIKQLVDSCLDAEGYLLFSARLTKNEDGQGRPMVDFNYRRYHFSLEDSKQAINALDNFVKEEIERLMRETEDHL